MYHMDGYNMWGHGFWGIIMWLILIILLGLVFYYLLGNKRSNSSDSGNLSSSRPSESPLDILKKRYARGDISKEEFDRVRKDLE